MAGYSVRVKRDIARWVEQGLIAPAIAGQLVRDVEQNERKAMSFGSVLAMMAALLFGAAILVLIAANWEAFPRLLRVAALFATILGGYVGGAVLKTRDHAAAGEALYLIAAAAFGASIALIGQMYHMSGDESAALVTWCVGTGIAALALRSNPLTIAAARWRAPGWCCAVWTIWPSSSAPHLFIVLAALLWLVSYWTRQQAGASSDPAVRHLLCRAACRGRRQRRRRHRLAARRRLGGAVCRCGAAARPRRAVARLDGHFVVHCLIGFLVGIGMIRDPADGRDPGRMALPGGDRLCRHCRGNRAGRPRQPVGCAGSPMAASAWNSPSSIR